MHVVCFSRRSSLPQPFASAPPASDRGAGRMRAKAAASKIARQSLVLRSRRSSCDSRELVCASKVRTTKPRKKGERKEAKFRLGSWEFRPKWVSVRGQG